MSEGNLASAVAVPEQESIRQSPEHHKRRQSSTSDHDVKRRRLSGQGDTSPQSHRRRPSSPSAGQSDKPAGQTRRDGNREEDRKRGRRLFGALLGTLSQSSNSAAQKRREDIEKRQQDKLKNQDEVYDGLKKKRQERRATIRMQTRHAHMRASANFLKTRTEPVLYYKPWQLRRGDADIIRDQIEETESKIAGEVAEFERRYPPEAFAYEKLEPLSTSKPEEQQEQQESSMQQQVIHEDSHKVRPEAERVRSPGTVETSGNPAAHAPAPAVEDVSTHETDANHRDDDGGEVVEDTEDTVIY
ncbi:hypothetical protein N7468_003800 [Penicillium chermesinum]|uniref:Pinin/SDK/MemA protein domain-containing protein n=1 Tax=Penicillium chermesinum TaxID=63820 RepID=A0A9W9TRY4_9EURO|nr:uncharacterized protein N7468_003800 [Penicillium chermesinum]KAJ5239181.1 hypothetical protein N7468_003800 [Penicillium chermesinum]